MRTIAPICRGMSHAQAHHRHVPRHPRPRRGRTRRSPPHRPPSRALPGRHRERYQAAIRGVTEIIQAADDMGIWGAATPEHHFWSEGYEVAPSPGATNAYWLAKTKNLHVGPLGYVMSTQNPIRVAE